MVKGMKVVRDTIVAGKTIYRNIKCPSGKHKGKRAAKKNVTPEKVQKNNDRIALVNLWMLLNANFDSSGAHWTLTYEGDAPGKDVASRALKKFIRKIRREMKKWDKELKYVMVTEYENHRIHHHVVLNTKDTDLVESCWDHGFVRCTPLDESGDYHNLAEYLIKETNKTFRQEGGSKRRYTASRNLQRPVTKREHVNTSELGEEPEALPGYYIPKDAVRWYEHPVTGLMHLEYIEIAINEPRRYKVWPRGKVATRERYEVDSYEDQMGWEV